MVEAEEPWGLERPGGPKGNQADPEPRRRTQESVGLFIFMELQEVSGTDLDQVGATGALYYPRAGTGSCVHLEGFMLAVMRRAKQKQGGKGRMVIGQEESWQREMVVRFGGLFGG